MYMRYRPMLVFKNLFCVVFVMKFTFVINF